MSVVRLAERKQFTIIAQESIRDERLSLKARGLHAYLLSFPDNWEFSIKHITESLKDGRASVRSALAELVELGYAERIMPRNKDGTVSGTTYLVYESPKDRNSDSRSPGNRKTENRTLGRSDESGAKSNKNSPSTERPKDRHSVMSDAILNTEEEPNTNTEPSKSARTTKSDRNTDPPNSRRCRNLDELVLDKQDYAWCAEKCPGVDPDEILEELKEWKAKKRKNRYDDWHAGWQGFCRMEYKKIKDRPHSKPNKHQTRAADLQKTMREADAILRQSYG